MNTLEVLIICATIIGVLSIICYTVSYILTHETLIKVIRNALRGNE